MAALLLAGCAITPDSCGCLEKFTPPAMPLANLDDLSVMLGMVYL